MAGKRQRNSMKEVRRHEDSDSHMFVVVDGNVCILGSFGFFCV